MKEFINDADYKVTKMVDGKQTMCPFFRTWRNMKERCNKASKRNPSYLESGVIDDWYTFSNFKAWMEGQPWQGNELDKDILGDGKLYSPNTCCFVPSWVNLLLVLSNSSRGEYPVGVSYMKRPSGMSRELVNPYQSYVKSGDKKKHLGMFSTAMQAHKAWQAEKIVLMEAAVLRYSEDRSFQQPVFDALQSKVLALRQDLVENRETVSL